MPRTKIGPAQPDRKTLDIEIGRLRDLDVGALRARWQTLFGRRPPPHLPRHLLFRIMAYRLQADLLGDPTPRASVCLIARNPPSRPDSVPHAWPDALSMRGPARCWDANGMDRCNG
jgi:Protein of unknown function (DUF2924)